MEQTTFIEDRRVSMIEMSCLLTGLAGIVLVEVSPVITTVLIAVAFLGFYATTTPRHAMFAVLWLLPFDLQRQIGNQWIYLDLSFALVLFVLVRTAWRRPLWWAWAPYIAYVLVSGATRALKPDWFYGFLVRLLIAMIIFAVASVTDLGAAAIVTVGSTTVVLTLYGAYQLATGGLGGLFFFFHPHYANQLWTDRAYSLLWQPNNLGGFCAIAFGMTFALIMTGYRQAILKWIAGAALLGVLLSGSRGALVGFLVTTTLICVIRKKLRFIAFVGSGVGAAVGLAFILRLSFAQRLFENDEVGVDLRVVVDGLGWAQFLSHPFFGVGVTNFAGLLNQLIPWHFDPIPVHNIYIEQLAESGVFGLLLFWVPVVVLVRRAWPLRFDGVVLAGLAMISTFAVHGLFDYMMEGAPQYMFLFFAMAGMLCGRINRLSQSGIVSTTAVGPAVYSALQGEAA